jgi:two-component system, chemotaxis family, protein-glutamate methylesterase/glutaminase
MVDHLTPLDPSVRRLIGVGASAGGIEALLQMVADLPEDLAATVLVVLHIPANGHSMLPQILARRTAVEVVTAEHGARLRSGQVVVAPPDRHLVVVDGQVRLERGPKENGVRPAVDPMLRSVAAAAGPRGVAVVLSGALGDGSDGAAAVAAAGGAVVVQDPADAIVPSMPQRSLQAVDGEVTVLPASEIGSELARLAATEAPAVQEVPTMANSDITIERSRRRPDGPATGFTCPDCNGALWEISGPGGRKRYRCRIGHAYSEDALIGAQSDRVEAALWTALEVLEERAELFERMAAGHGDARPKSAARMRAAAADAMERAELLRGALAATEAGPDALALDVQDVAT